jgi:hypothetical protein
LPDHPDEICDEADGFFFDVVRMPDGSGQRIKVRTDVGLLPLCAATSSRRPASLEVRYRRAREAPGARRAAPGVSRAFSRE